MHTPPFALDRDETPAFVVERPHGRGAFVLVGDHAGAEVPRCRHNLGLGDDERLRHIGWDIGVRALGSELSARLDAPFVHQRFSRLLADCNRDPAAPACIATNSDGTLVPGNAALDLHERNARLNAVHAPYHAAIAALLTRRGKATPTVLLSLHSFTPRLRISAHPPDYVRPWQIGVLHHEGDTRFALALLKRLQQEPDLTVGDNEPYRMDGTDYTVPLHAYPRGLAYAELEVRQDLIDHAAGVGQVADVLARALLDAL